MGINSRTVLFSSAAIAAFGACMAGVPMAMATTTATPTTIISDTFPASQGVGAGGYLQGSTPDGVDLPGSTWTTNYVGGTLSSASDPFIGPPPNALNNPASSVAIFPNAVSGDVAAAIAFTPTGNGIISLTATLDWEGGSWLAMGFANSVATANPGNKTGPWMLISSSVQMFGGTGGTGNYVIPAVNGHTNTVTFTYNPVTMVESVTVSNPTKGSDYLSGSQPLSYFKVTTPPTINSIYFATRGAAGNGSNFSNLTLTQGPEQAVPEPASWGLLGLGGVAGLMLLRRRKLA